MKELASLDKKDFDSATWAKLIQHYEARLMQLRIQNDNTMSKKQRYQLIGQIAEVKYLLNLSQPKPVAEHYPEE